MTESAENPGCGRFDVSDTELMALGRIMVRFLDTRDAVAAFCKNWVEVGLTGIEIDGYIDGLSRDDVTLLERLVAQANNAETPAQPSEEDQAGAGHVSRGVAGDDGKVE